MQSNSRYFSRNEESRLLEDIRVHRQGIAKLEKYEEKKQIRDELSRSMNAKKAEIDQSWNMHNEFNAKIPVLSEECRNLKTEIERIDAGDYIKTNDASKLNFIIFI